MVQRERDHREFTDDEKRVLGIIEEELGYKYIGNLFVREVRNSHTKDVVGYELELCLNNLDKPIYITYMGESKQKFFDVVRMQIHEDNIPSHVEYCLAQRYETISDCNNGPVER